MVWPIEHRLGSSLINVSFNSIDTASHASVSIRHTLQIQIFDHLKTVVLGKIHSKTKTLSGLCTHRFFARMGGEQDQQRALRMVN